MTVFVRDLLTALSGIAHSRGPACLGGWKVTGKGASMSTNRRLLITSVAAVLGIASLTAPMATSPGQAAEKSKPASKPADTGHKGCDKYDKSSKEYTDCMNTN